MTVDGDLAGHTSIEEEEQDGATEEEDDETTEKDGEDTFEAGSFYTKMRVSSRFQNTFPLDICIHSHFKIVSSRLSPVPNS